MRHGGERDGVESETRIIIRRVEDVVGSESKLGRQRERLITEVRKLTVPISGAADRRYLSYHQTFPVRSPRQKPASKSDLSHHQFQPYTTRQYGRRTRYTPALLLPEGGKEPVASEVAHLVQRAVDELLEPLVIADLRDERVRVDVHRDAPVGVLEAIDLAVLRGEQRERA